MHKSHHPNRAPNSISNPNVLQVTVVTGFVIKILVATVNAHQINPKSGPNKCGIWMIRGTQIWTIWVVICVGFGPTVNAPIVTHNIIILVGELCQNSFSFRHRYGGALGSNHKACCMIQ